MQVRHHLRNFSKNIYIIKYGNILGLIMKKLFMKRLYTIIMALATLVVSANAQSLSVQNIEAQMDEETALVVSLAEGSSMTALQFNLSLPEGVTLTTSGDTYGTTLGTATDGHTLDVETLSNGDLLFILYNMDQKAFKSGELLRIPLTAGSTATEANGKLYTVRTATADAVSHTCADVSFSVKVTEPEPAYKVGDDITSLATAEWEGKTNDYGGFANPAVERYTHGAPNDVGGILTQTVNGLENGTYRVQLEAAASFTPERGFECPTGDGLSVAFANGTQRNLPVLERGWVGEGEQKLVTLTATVTDGTLKYGIKNLAPSGNWFVARLKSIVYVSTDAQSPKTYAISIASEKNGKTTTDVTADEEGSRVFITATPDEDCTLESLKVTTTGGKEVAVTGNSFIMPASAVKVTATYKEDEATSKPKVADLAVDMFHKWTGFDAEAIVADPDQHGGAIKVGEETDCPFGNTIVTEYEYADLSAWDYLTVVLNTADQPRMFLNSKGGSDRIQVNTNDANYVVSNENGVIVYNLAAIKAAAGFVHLNAIKASAYDKTANVAEMKLANGEPYIPTGTAIEDVIADDGTYQIYTIDGKPVEALQQGVNIIKYQNGTTKKVLVK